MELTDENGMAGDDGKFYGCAWFDGAGSYLIFNPIDGWNQGMDWSFSFWIKSESEDDFWGIWSFSTHSGNPETDWLDEPEGVGGVFMSSYDGIFEVEISWLGGLYPDEADPPPAWNDGEWHHVVLTYSVDNEDMYMYMDNMLYAGPPEDPLTIADDIEYLNTEEDAGASIEDDNIKLGFAGAGWNDWEEGQQFPDIMWFDGYMDDVRLFNITLSEEEITEIFQYSPDEETGLSNAQSTRLFRVYPNPASDYIQIQAESNNVEVKIYNISGQKVMRSFGQTKINISSLSQGIYFLEANMHGKRAVQKLIIE